MTLKIIKELEFWYNINLDDAVVEFEKLDKILTKIYGYGHTILL